MTEHGAGRSRPATGGGRGYLRIATEEAFAPPELITLWRDMIDKRAYDDPGFVSLVGYYAGARSERAAFVFDRLQDLGERRLADMDAAGIDRQVISLTAPGTQVLEPGDAAAIAALANDRLAEACRRHPERFSGLTAIAPQDPAGAAREIERGHRELGFNGVIINSHTKGEYLDDPTFVPLLEAAEALDTPIYRHPNTAPKNFIQPMLDAGLDGAIWGFAVETGTHLLRLITKGVFDRFPRLKMVVGHLGEALPFWMYRLNVDRDQPVLPAYEKLFVDLGFTELPQLWNVLRGDMDLVGPRPEPPERVKHYSDWQRQRLKIRPGITGLAQIHGLRDQHPAEQKTPYDLQYILRWSPFLDLSLILQTVWTLGARLWAQKPARAEALPDFSRWPTDLETSFEEVAYVDHA